MANERKPRILYVAKILFEQTDPEHGLTLPEIQERLQDHSIPSERKALYRDFAALREAGFDIQKLPTRPVSYCLGQRLFTAAQMALIQDAVRTSRSITEANALELMERLRSLQSTHEAARSRADVHVTGRAKAQNDAVMTTLAQIQQAMAEKRDLSFEYLRYDTALRQVPTAAADGMTRVKTPLFLVYADDNYYLLVFDEHAPDRLRSYRVDRMANVMIRGASDASHKPDPTFDIRRFERERLGMYNGEPVRIALSVPGALMGSIVDLFGREGTQAVPADEEGKRATVHLIAAPSPVFFGQIAQFGGDVRIVGPSSVMRAYEEHLEGCLAAQSDL